MALIRSPTPKAVEREFTKYASAVGRVSHSWNTLIETLATVLGTLLANPVAARALWYSLASDRAQINVLIAVLKTFDSERFGGEKNKGDALWALEKTRKLGISRNTAVHAPLTGKISHFGFEIMPNYFSGNVLAQSLKGKHLLKEFRWYEETADCLIVYFQHVTSCLYSPKYAWPDRPRLPKLGPTPKSPKQSRPNFPKSLARPLSPSPE